MEIYLSTYRKRQHKQDWAPERSSVPVTECIKSMEELAKLQKETAWSQAVFSGWRDKKNFQSSSLVVLDIDDGNLIEFKNKVLENNHACLITLSTSHQKPGKGDRFRATFLLSKTFQDSTEFTNINKRVIKIYNLPGVEANPDPVKSYWKSDGGNGEYWIFEGGYVDKLNKSETSIEELKNKVCNEIPVLRFYFDTPIEKLNGRFNNTVHRAAYALGARGYTLDETINIISSKQQLEDLYINSVIPNSHTAGLSQYSPDKRHGLPFEVFFEEFKVLHNLRCLPTGMVYIDGELRPDDFIISKMITDSSKYKIKGKFKEYALAYLIVWKDAEMKKERDLIREVLTFTEENEEIRKFIYALKGLYNPLDIAVMKHWIWQIKRKFLGKEVVHHLMPVLFGKPRSGKSTAVEKLTAPVRHLSMQGELTMLNDSRQDFNLTEKLIIVFDELAKADRVCVAALKQKITSNDVTYRRLGTNQNTVGRNMCSFIGTCNDRLIDTIVDPTGMRRFYEIETQAVCDWKLINSINYQALWSGVNENEEVSPIEPFIHELTIEQEKLREKKMLEQFTDEYELVPEDKTIFISSEVLFEKYKEWLTHQNKQNFLYTKNRFFRELKNMLVSGRTAKCRGYYVNHEHTMPQLQTIDSSDILIEDHQ